MDATTRGKLIERYKEGPRVLTEEQWARGGTHAASGPYGVETWLEIYAAHAHDHADQIRRARQAARAGS
jgi:hypothetical protein